MAAIPHASQLSDGFSGRGGRSSWNLSVERGSSLGPAFFFRIREKTRGRVACWCSCVFGQIGRCLPCRFGKGLSREDGKECKEVSQRYGERQCQKIHRIQTKCQKFRVIVHFFYKITFVTIILPHFMNPIKLNNNFSLQ